MVRWSVMLATALGVLAISIGAILWIAGINDSTAESVRQTRVAHQRLQQQFNVLKSTAHERQIEQLSQDMDALQISLVEAVSKSPLPSGVLDIAFEQQVLAPMLDAGAAYPVSILRLSLTLTLEHSVGLMNMLDRLAGVVPAWPFEVRGCAMQRLALQQLNTQCVVDFYHWADSTAQPDEQALQADRVQQEES